MAGTCTESCSGDFIAVFDPQATPLGCYGLNNGSTTDSLNGLSLLSGKRNGLIFSDPYSDQFLMDPGHCIKHCVDFSFTYAALGNGTDCRCGKDNGLETYSRLDDRLCNTNCTLHTLKGSITYPCGSKVAYTVYKAESPNYESPKITLDQKLDIMHNNDNDPNYRGCIEDNKYCGQRVLMNKCDSNSEMTVNKCMDLCREGNYKYAGLEAGTQCFCGNSYDAIGRLVGSDRCSASCSGNSTQLCGGSWALSTYEIPPHPLPDQRPLQIGLGVGIPIFIFLLAFFFYYLRRRKMKRNRGKPNSDNIYQ